MYDAMLPRLDALCAGYALEAMRELGWHPAVGEEVDANALAERLGVVDAQRPLFRRLLGILEEDGFLVRTARGGRCGGRWRPRPRPRSSTGWSATSLRPRPS